MREKELGGAGVQALQTSVPKPGSHFLGDIFKAVSLLLLALGVLSLALSGFLVITTISALMAQQIRQIGIMKAVGARWGQVMRMYLATVVLYGVLAVLVGVPVALWAGRWFISYAAGLLNFRVINWNPPAYVIALEVAVGLLVPFSPRSCRFDEAPGPAWSPRSTPRASRRTSVTGSSTGFSASSEGCRDRSRSRFATRSCARAGSR